MNKRGLVKGGKADFCTFEVQKYEEVRRSTEKYRKYDEVRRSTEKYKEVHEVQKSACSPLAQAR